MSAPELPARPEHGDPDVETGRPSVTITRNAKGSAQWTVKVYGLEVSAEAALAAAEVAKGIYDDLTVRYGSGS